MNSAEKVFCIARKDLEENGLLDGNPDLSEFLRLPHHFFPRYIAESDVKYKQIIPYQIFCCGGRFFVFQRGSGVGEQRLSGRLSIGIGGHVNDEDCDNTVMSEPAFLAALMRERQEELMLSGSVKTSFAGIINDDSDPVGQVHLGVVFLCQVRQEHHITLGEDEDLHFEGWWTMKEIKEKMEGFEKWSLLALDVVTGEIKKW